MSLLKSGGRRPWRRSRRRSRPRGLEEAGRRCGGRVVARKPSGALPAFAPVDPGAAGPWGAALWGAMFSELRPPSSPLPRTPWPPRGGPCRQSLRTQLSGFSPFAPPGQHRVGRAARAQDSACSHHACPRAARRCRFLARGAGSGVGSDTWAPSRASAAGAGLCSSVLWGMPRVHWHLPSQKWPCLSLAERPGGRRGECRCPGTPPAPLPPSWCRTGSPGRCPGASARLAWLPEPRGRRCPRGALLTAPA